MFQLPPLENHEGFEKLIRDICRIIFNEQTFELYGKRGEEQNGIDGYKLINNEVIAFQCKEKDITSKSDSDLIKKLTLEMKSESGKAFNFFKNTHPVKKYIFASTFKNTKHLQDLAAELSNELGFAVEYWGWQTITRVTVLQLMKEKKKMFGI